MMEHPASNSNEEASALHDKPLSAWEAAAAEGIDMSLLELTLRMPPAERFEQHARVLRFAAQLRLAMEREHGRPGS